MTVSAFGVVSKFGTPRVYSVGTEVKGVPYRRSDSVETKYEGRSGLLRRKNYSAVYLSSKFPKGSTVQTSVPGRESKRASRAIARAHDSNASTMEASDGWTFKHVSKSAFGIVHEYKEI